MDRGTRHVDKEIIDTFGMSSCNSYFVEDMLIPAMSDGESLCKFVGDDNTEVTFWFDTGFFYEARGRDVSPEDAERMCSIVMRDFNEVPAKVEQYRLGGDVTAFEQYRTEHGDVKLAYIETYSDRAYERHMRKDAEAALGHCHRVIGDFMASGLEFDPAAFCDIRDTIGAVESRAQSLGITTAYTSFGKDSLGLMRDRLAAGLFAINDEYDIYSDMYKDQYGFRPRDVVPDWLTREDETMRMRAVEEYDAGRQGMTCEEARTRTAIEEPWADVDALTCGGSFDFDV